MNENASYDLVAEEYYDAARHPTCANFRELGIKALSEMSLELKKFGDFNKLNVLETGAGKSTVAEYYSSIEKSLKNLTIQDSSELMLLHSSRWTNQILNSFVSDARAMPIRSATFDCVYSFLLDPYDTPELWLEINRVAKVGARWVMTSPSRDWSVQFRSPEGSEASEFLGSSGELFSLPSITYSPADRIHNLKLAGWEIEYFKVYDTSDITGEVSHKLVKSENTRNLVLDSFIFFKR